MKDIFRWLKPTRTRLSGPQEKKSLGQGSVVALSQSLRAGWSNPGYASLSHVGYMQNPIVHRCVRMICESSATIPIVLFVGDREVRDHPLMDLMRRPNPRQGGQQFMESILGHLLLAGNAYVEAVFLDEKPREFHALRPDCMQIIKDNSGWVSAFEYSNQAGKVRYPVGDDGHGAILHLSQFHPLDDHYGFPPLRAALMALDVHNSANRWNKALLDNSARPSGALIYSTDAGSNLSDDQFARLKDELEEGYSGASRAGRPLLLEGGLDWKSMSHSPKDMDFVDARNSAARDIALAFGVPPMLLGIPGDNTYSNYQEANRAFLRQTILPLMTRTLGSIEHWAERYFESDTRLEIDRDQIEALSSEREALWNRIGNADFLSDEEKRSAVGYGRMEAGR